ncbi:MAG: hypothetical protein ABWZ40_14130 [Caulobacterales bacterium]
MSRFRSALTATLTLLAAAAPVTALAQPPKPPPEVVAAANAILMQDPFHPPEKASPKLYRQVDVTGDGEKDWILDFMHAQSGTYCGTGGCPLRIWVRDAQSGAWRQELEMRHFHYSLPRGGGITIAVHGVHCGGSGADDCRLDYVWSATDRRFIERSGAPKSLLMIVPARPLRDDELPAALRDARADFALACTSKGGKPDTGGSVASIPDINGDGLRDWVFDGFAAFCDKDGDQIMPPCAGEECEVEAFVTDSRAPTGARRVFRGPVYWTIGFNKTGPADLMAFRTDADCNGPGQKRCVFEKAATPP